MNKDRNTDRTGVKSVYPPVLPLIVMTFLIYLAYGYGETARQLPVLVGTATLVLIILDVLSRFHGKVGTLIRTALGAGFQDRELTHDFRWQSELVQLAWVSACVISIALIGILPTVPTFILLYMVLQGKQGVVLGITVSLIAFLLVGLLFEVLLDYELYRGMLFDQDGFD